MKVQVSIEFTYGKQMSKDIEKFAREKNLPIENIVKKNIEKLLDKRYICADDESYIVRAELLED